MLSINPLIAYGEPGAARTLDPRLKRALLYQLSYGLSPEGNVNRTGVGCRDHSCFFKSTLATRGRPETRRAHGDVRSTGLMRGKGGISGAAVASAWSHA